MSLARRVANLEDYSGGVCSECGHDPDAVVTYEIHWANEPDAPVESSLPCHRCGNQSVVVVDWPDERSEKGASSAPQVSDYPPWNNEGGGEGEL